ncbi:metal ABC transporter solute-binding protein, Zn/Mn family [Paenibacillus typhae]|uniref:Zinc transport system substrate-binding protein n=1 Tax=Paenibacillus typhae TaxID=1174501 RepID=A0A1G8EV96_9BACL|nr:zinc ABC transporter substrate-binding protein [Paenibacillus typhae]SDH73816.1 zinc transport system substrate-binding protein [Paenibacillus typhae]
MLTFKIRHLAALSLSALLIAAGCGSNNSPTGNAAATNAGGNANTAAADTGAAPADKLDIKVSFYPMYEFTRHVAGDLADVELLVPAGVEPHDWEPTAQDMARITDADMLIYNGAGMESWTAQVLDSASGSKLIAVEASKGLEIMESAEGEEAGHDHEHAEEAHSTDDHDHEHAEEAHSTADHDHEHAGEAHGTDDHDHEHAEEAPGTADHDHEHTEEPHGTDDHDHAEASHTHDHGGLDPHVWLAPSLAIQEVRTIEAALSAAAPAHAAAFKTNADSYIAELEQLDKDFKDGLASTKRKDFITQHAAFGYLAKEYGLTQVPIAGLSPEQEPSAAQMAEIVEFAKANDVKTIFFETLVSSSVAETIAQEIGAKTAVLNPIEGLTDEERSSNMDYISVMRQNLEALKIALNE